MALVQIVEFLGGPHDGKIVEMKAGSRVIWVAESEPDVAFTPPGSNPVSAVVVSKVPIRLTLGSDYEMRLVADWYRRVKETIR